MTKGRVGLILAMFVFVWAACATHKADTPENAFMGYTFAGLRNRKEMLKKFATPEHLLDLESVFDLTLVSASWPANVEIQRSLTRGDTAVVVAQGLGREKTAVFGSFFLSKQKDQTWQVASGGWFGYAPENLEEALDSQEKMEYGAY